MIVDTARVTVRPDKRTEFFQTISELLSALKTAKGCLGFRFYIDTTNENSFLLIGEWETESDLENHLDSEEFSILRGAITILCNRRDEFRASINSSARQAVGRKIGMTTFSPDRF